MIAGSLEQGTGESLQRISDHPHKDLFKPPASEQGGVIRSMALIKFARQIGRLLEADNRTLAGGIDSFGIQPGLP